MTLLSVRWVAEAREPDGTWKVVVGPLTLRDVLRGLRRFKDSGWHLDTETRVRQLP